MIIFNALRLQLAERLAFGVATSREIPAENQLYGIYGRYALLLVNAVPMGWRQQCER